MSLLISTGLSFFFLSTVFCVVDVSLLNTAGGSAGITQAGAIKRLSRSVAIAIVLLFFGWAWFSVLGIRWNLLVRFRRFWLFIVGVGVVKTAPRNHAVGIASEENETTCRIVH